MFRSVVNGLISAFQFWLATILNFNAFTILYRVLKFNFDILSQLYRKRTYKRVEYDEDSIARGDEYIDEMLRSMFADEARYEPYEIEDSVVGFYKKVMFVNVSGEAKLHNGYIRGLSTLHRYHHCSLHEEENRLNVKADLGAGVLDMNYAGSVKFMNFGPTVTVHGKLAYVEVHIEFTVDQTGKDGKLTKFVIDEMKGMSVWITGLGPLNWAVNPIVSGVMAIFKRYVKNFLENKVENHIREHLPSFQFPVVGDGVSPTESETAEPTAEVTTENLTDGTESPETSETEINELTEEVVETTQNILTDEKKTTEIEITDVTEEIVEMTAVVEETEPVIVETADPEKEKNTESGDETDKSSGEELIVEQADVLNQSMESGEISPKSEAYDPGNELSYIDEETDSNDGRF